MPRLEPVESPAADALAHAAFDGLGCEDFGIAIARGASSWGTRETGAIEIPRADTTLQLGILHDEREAPYVVGSDGHEAEQTLVSLTDEGETLACAWVRTRPGSPLLGIGVDLASSSDFDDRPFTQRFIELVFSDAERELVRTTWPDNLTIGYATVFGAKEAAFKATAAPLRTWYRSHDEKLGYEVRHFCLVSEHEAKGIMRNAAAQRAMEKMGVKRIVVHYTQTDDLALVVAAALAE